MPKKKSFIGSTPDLSLYTLSFQGEYVLDILPKLQSISSSFFGPLGQTFY